MVYHRGIIIVPIIFKKGFMTRYLYLWLLEPYNSKLACREGFRLRSLYYIAYIMALASATFIVNPCIDIRGCLEGQGGQFGNWHPSWSFNF